MSGTYVENDPKIWIEYWFALFIRSLFVNKQICFESFIQRQHSIWIECWYQLFICCTFLDNNINSKSSLSYHGKYSTKIFLSTVRLWAVYRWQNEREVFRWKAAKHLNGIVVQSIQLLSVRRGQSQLEILGFSGAKHWNRRFLWTIHFFSDYR